MPELRTENFVARMTPTEIAMLRKLADAAGLSAADIIRQHVRKAYLEQFGKKKPKRAT